jgi:hypothetical protein
MGRTSLVILHMNSKLISICTEFCPNAVQMKGKLKLNLWDSDLALKKIPCILNLE